MSQIMFMTLLSMNSLVFASMSHPMNMGIMLLAQTLFMCLMTSCVSQTSWFSYILFLVFLGGMLVLFVYMTSIASNEMFQKSNYPLILILMTMMFIMCILMVFSDPFMTSFNNNDEMSTQMALITENKKFMMIHLYNNPMSNITIFMVLYLLLTLIVIVAITKSNSGPLRPSN